MNGTNTPLPSRSAEIPRPSLSGVAERDMSPVVVAVALLLVEGVCILVGKNAFTMMANVTLFAAYFVWPNIKGSGRRSSVGKPEGNGTNSLLFRGALLVCVVCLWHYMTLLLHVQNSAELAENSGKFFERSSNETGDLRRLNRAQIRQAVNTAKDSMRQELQNQQYRIWMLEKQLEKERESKIRRGKLQPWAVGNNDSKTVLSLHKSYLPHVKPIHHSKGSSDAEKPSTKTFKEFQRHKEKPRSQDSEESLEHGEDEVITDQDGWSHHAQRTSPAAAKRASPSPHVSPLTAMYASPSLPASLFAGCHDAPDEEVEEESAPPLPELPPPPHKAPRRRDPFAPPPSPPPPSPRPPPPPGAENVAQP
ncbi:hypothetical protein CYMTET_48422, partial [Cymbomonas tetramitiformis]